MLPCRVRHPLVYHRSFTPRTRSAPSRTVGGFLSPLHGRLISEPRHRRVPLHERCTSRSKASTAIPLRGPETPPGRTLYHGPRNWRGEPRISFLRRATRRRGVPTSSIPGVARFSYRQPVARPAARRTASRRHRRRFHIALTVPDLTPRLRTRCRARPHGLAEPISTIRLGPVVLSRSRRSARPCTRSWSASASRDLPSGYVQRCRW